MYSRDVTFHVSYITCHKTTKISKSNKQKNVHVNHPCDVSSLILIKQLATQDSLNTLLHQDTYVTFIIFPDLLIVQHPDPEKNGNSLHRTTLSRYQEPPQHATTKKM